MKREEYKKIVKKEIDILISEYRIDNKEFVEITDDIKIGKGWNNG